MTQQAAECINVHSVHKAALCKVIAQAMRRNVFLNSRPSYIALEIDFKAADIHGHFAFLRWEQILRFNVSVFVLQLVSQYAFGLLREENRAFALTFCNICSYGYLPPCYINIAHLQH